MMIERRSATSRLALTIAICVVAATIVAGYALIEGAAALALSS